MGTRSVARGESGRGESEGREPPQSAAPTAPPPRAGERIARLAAGRWRGSEGGSRGPRGVSGFLGGCSFRLRSLGPG
ncbi:MAG: hypothetical protein EA378_03905 [Phycisphaerales bacterium]|nr:MAG: hypothetical protein EA378_03905 [Phycisphaerales bacterium]